MKPFLLVALFALMTACSAHVSAPALTLPDQKANTPAPTGNAAHFDGQDFAAAKAVLIENGFYEGFHRLLILPADAVSPCTAMQSKYVEVSIPKASPEDKVILDTTGTYAKMLLYYDYAGGANHNIGIGEGWFQLTNFADATKTAITVNATDGTNFIQGTYPVQKCF